MPTSSDLALLDTNILVYAMNEDAPQHNACHAILEQAYAGKMNVCLTPQILFEYFAVITSAQELSTPVALPEALNDLERLMAVFPILQAPYDLAGHVMELMRATKSSGRAIFDIQLAATMLANGVEAIYTYDKQFAKIPGIKVFLPEGQYGH